MSCGAPAVAAAGPRQRKARSGATGTPVPSRTRDPARGSAETARGSWPRGSRGRSLSQVGRIGGRESRWSGESVVWAARESRSALDLETAGLVDDLDLGPVDGAGEDDVGRGGTEDILRHRAPARRLVQRAERRGAGEHAHRAGDRRGAVGGGAVARRDGVAAGRADKAGGGGRGRGLQQRRTQRTGGDQGAQAQLDALVHRNSSCGGEWLTGSGGSVNRAPEVSAVPRAVLKWTLVLRQTSWTEVVGPVRAGAAARLSHVDSGGRGDPAQAGDQAAWAASQSRA